MCGDGANDCGALRAAHTGISLSEAESSVASPFTSKNPNISCVLNVIREGRAALVTSFGIFKYMAAYSLCQFISVLLLYSIDSNLTDMEFLYIDLAIISVFAFFFGKTEAYTGKLVKETPLSSLVSVSPILSLLTQIVLVLIFQVATFEHVKSEPWYKPHNATSDDDIACVDNYTLYTISSFQYIILAVVFSKGYPYRKSIFSNYGFIISSIVMTGISVYMALIPAPIIVNAFELILPEDFNFRIYLLIYAAANFVIGLLVEHLLIEEIFFKRLRFKFHKVDKSKRKYLAVERDLNNETKWPALSSDYKSAASPLSPQPVYSTEIVIERENRFDKNHVLNKLFEADVARSPKTNGAFRLENGVNETGYFSQDDLVFSSLPSETSPSDNFHSFSNNTNDLASSIVNIPELPFDDGHARHDEVVSNFNSFGRSPPQTEVFKPLELNNLQTNR